MNNLSQFIYRVRPPTKREAMLLHLIHKKNPSYTLRELRRDIRRARKEQAK